MPPPEASDPTSDRWFDLDRTLAFTDAVIAVAITLLVVALEVPDAEDAAEALDEIGLTLLFFAVSFWLIAGFWLEHHQLGRRLTAVDVGWMRINLLFLAAISLISFGTALFGEYSGDTLALAVYTVILVSAGGTLNWLGRYAQRHGLLRDARPADDQDALTMIVRTTIFLVAIPLSLLTPWAPLVWLLSFRARAIANGLRRLGS